MLLKAGIAQSALKDRDLYFFWVSPASDDVIIVCFYCMLPHIEIITRAGEKTQRAGAQALMWEAWVLSLALDNLLSTKKGVSPELGVPPPQKKTIQGMATLMPLLWPLIPYGIKSGHANPLNGCRSLDKR